MSQLPLLNDRPLDPKPPRWLTPELPAREGPGASTVPPLRARGVEPTLSPP
jgi:hypothetical protein